MARRYKKMILLLVISQVLLVGMWHYRNTQRKPRSGRKHVTDKPHRHPSTTTSPQVYHVTEDIDIDVAGPTSIAIGLAITTRKLRPGSILDKMPFFNSLLTSFCQTCSVGYQYGFYLAYDYNDPYLSNETFRTFFTETFSEYVNENCDSRSNFSLHYVKCEYTGKPAWAQNDAMMAAYVSGMEFFYRINDDTIMESTRWTEAYIGALEKMDPPLVGVVGPRHTGGNIRILTYDFTYRTHLDIHGFYYPRVFTGWYADDWITQIYRPGRSQKVNSVLLKHTTEHGRRYNRTIIKRDNLKPIITAGKRSVFRYVKAYAKGFAEPNPRRVISMVIDPGKPDDLWGAFRNAQLAPVFFPTWTVRVYVKTKYENIQSRENSIYNPEQILNLLDEVGAHVLFANNVTLTNRVSPIAMHYLVADDPTVDVFLIRDPRTRLNGRDASSVQDWLNQSDNPKAVHCMKDHTRHTEHNITEGLWGARTQPLRSLLHGKTMFSLLADFTNTTKQNELSSDKFVQSFLDTVLWELTRNHLVCYNGVKGLLPAAGDILVPVKKSFESFVGQRFNAYGIPLKH